jgi:cyanophycinase
MTRKPQGQLIIIGGGLLKEGAEPIAEKIAELSKKSKGPLVIINAATYEPDDVFEDHIEFFGRFGITEVEGVDIRCREDAHNSEKVAKCVNAGIIFFTGGDQLRITSQIGDSPLFTAMHDLYAKGGIIAGTSAGAAAMPATMIIGGPSDESSRTVDISMAPGLGLLQDTVVDSHFAERGRIGRLLGAVAQNPRNLGLGIDESTAIVVDKGESFTTFGNGAVYVVDGTNINYSSLSEKKTKRVTSIFGVKLHILAQGDCFDLIDRQPVMPKVYAE